MVGKNTNLDELMTVSAYQVDEHIKSDYITGFKEFASSNDFILNFEMNTLLFSEI